jgi:DNA polymerase V
MNTDNLYMLIDCNNFFVSCERVFRPDLRNKPVAVLSSNDGCVVARSNEVKKLGIPMGAPIFKYKEQVKKYNIILFSGNFQLYGDISRRVMDVLRSDSWNVEVYSIDEAFANLRYQKIPDLEQYARKIREKILRYVGVPISVGIAPTKTLAKVAAQIAKKNDSLNGVFIMKDFDKIDQVLKNFEISDIWGIGYRFADRLRRQGIYTALDLKNTDERTVRQILSVSGERVVLELRGISCSGVDSLPETRKSIICSRSFGKKVTELRDLKESVSHFASKAAEKLRKQKSYCNSIGVYLKIGKYNEEKYYTSEYEQAFLPTATNYTPDLIKYAVKCLERMYRPGVYYRKSGVTLGGIISKNYIQDNLFSNNLNDFSHNEKEMSVVDLINKKFSGEKIKYASNGLTQHWRNRKNLMSPRYTTKWEELLGVN